MEHGSSPTNYPGRTPSNQPPKCYGTWGVRPAHLVGHLEPTTKRWRQSGLRNLKLEAGFLWLEATAWWSWPGSNQPPTPPVRGLGPYGWNAAYRLHKRHRRAR